VTVTADPPRDDELERRLERLRERAAAPPPSSWRKEDEPELAGYYVSESTKTLGTGESCRVVVIADARTGEQRAVWLWHQVLRERLDEAQPQPGELVLIAYQGEGESAEGRAFHRYAVVVDRDTPGPPSRPPAGSRPDPPPASSSSSAFDADPGPDPTDPWANDWPADESIEFGAPE
jgi:hypothetical protein